MAAMSKLAVLGFAALAAAVAVDLGTVVKGNRAELVTRQSPSGGYFSHCWVSGIIDKQLQGNCGSDPSDPNADLHQVWLDLNLCFGNIDGTVYWEDHGNGLDSCDCSSKDETTSIMQCTCTNLDNVSVHNGDLDLNTLIRYDQGTLACFNNYGGQTS
ncbi:hypothetical protein P8C59_007717 [Phyllachora maydis]|uniref:Cyanovirin-N domain-containing protein n=1 Tax=Phyllachora maydis TaxID=1825666 RepID=A0AAD9IAS8_9PEZI|nr:hypothetical protein P8C59_007717 [Phyllachora maydis]